MFDVQMLQRMEAIIKSQTVDSMKPKSRLHGGLFLALLTVAPGHGLQMAQEKAEYIQQSWVSQRNVNYFSLISCFNPSGKSNLYVYGTLQGCIGKIYQSCIRSLLKNTSLLAYSTIR